MASRRTTGWKFKLATVVITLVAIAGVFGVAFSETGKEFMSMVRAAIPVGSGVVAAIALGSIDRLSNKRWQIYLAVLIAVAIFLLLRIYRIV